MKLVRLCLLPCAFLALSSPLGCNGGDLGPGSTHEESDAIHEEDAVHDEDAIHDEDMAGMDMAAPSDTAAEVGPTAADTSQEEGMAGMDMDDHDTATPPDTSMAGHEM